MPYRIYLDTDFRQMDTIQRAMHGEYASIDEAVDAARELVDAALQDLVSPGMSADALLKAFATRGEIPFIVPDVPSSTFDPKTYARIRSREMCTE